jgi:hypothetical protein
MQDRARRVWVVRTRRSCLPPSHGCLGEVLLEQIGDMDQQRRAGKRTGHPIAAAVISRVIRVKVIR